MPVPSQGHYGFHSFPVVDCSEFGNFVITFILDYHFGLPIEIYGFLNDAIMNKPKVLLPRHR